MSIAQQRRSPFLPRLNAVTTRWRRLIMIACDPYRPELHYMRGPGPKWRAKHHARSEGGAL